MLIFLFESVLWWLYLREAQKKICYFPFPYSHFLIPYSSFWRKYIQHDRLPGKTSNIANRLVEVGKAYCWWFSLGLTWFLLRYSCFFLNFHSVYFSTMCLCRNVCAALRGCLSVSDSCLAALVSGVFDRDLSESLPVHHCKCACSGQGLTRPGASRCSWVFPDSNLNKAGSVTSFSVTTLASFLPALSLSQGFEMQF